MSIVKFSFAFMIFDAGRDLKVTQMNRYQQWKNRTDVFSFS
uniref:Uncharacterized protein n=1 Tax=Arundo donax TaxID=35708 RepID=A0A0A8ZLT8_ARUDO